MKSVTVYIFFILHFTPYFYDTSHVNIIAYIAVFSMTKREDVDLDDGAG